VAHRILTAVYHMLLNHEPYRELRPAESEEQRKEQLVVRMQQRIERLGVQVSIVPMAAQAA
jgi:transposase